MADSVRFCQECGAKLIDGSSFCIECGNKLVTAPLPHEEVSEDNEMKKDEAFFNDLEKEKKGGISDNNKQWKPKPPKPKKEKSAAAKFFGFIFKLILFGIMLYFVYMMVKTQVGKDIPVDNNEEIINDSDNETEKKSLLNVPIKIDEENERVLLNDNILILKYLNSKISPEYEYPLIKNIFNAGEINDAESTDIYNAYNVTYQNSDYSAVVYYDFIEEMVVIDRIFVSKGKFSNAIIENIKSALAEG